MDHSRSRKRKIQKETAAPEGGQDFISTLPEEVKGKILSYLSTRDAVQTCLLSSRWRYTWASIPEISITEDDFRLPHASVRIIRSRFVKFVDVLLYLHDGPICTFKLDTENFYGDNYFRDAFDRWILHLSRRNEFREFSINFHSTSLYKLPTSFFSCHGLNFLKLCDCHIKLPRGFQGFMLLRVLELQGCLISGYDLEKIVSSCPILDEFVMKTGRSWIHNLDNGLSLKICASKLKKLIIHGKFVSLLLKTPCLVKACFDLEDVPAGINGHANLVEALGSLPEVEILGLHQQFFAVNKSVNFEV